MRLEIIDKQDLTPEQAKHLDERLTDSIHQFDEGPRVVWHRYPPDSLYAFVLTTSARPIAIAEASGPKEAVSAGWWIDADYRGKGYGHELVDLLAARLEERGYTGVGNMLVTTFRGEYDLQSRRLRDRFSRHFGHDGYQAH